MKGLKLCVLLLVFVLLQTTVSESKEVILQNGLNNYNGCSDTYIDSDNPYDNYCNTDEFYLRLEVFLGN